MALLAASCLPAVRAAAQALPDAPSTLLLAQAAQTTASTAQPQDDEHQKDEHQDGEHKKPEPEKLPHCTPIDWGWRLKAQPAVTGPCEQDPLQLIVNPGHVTPLSPKQKAQLAAHVTVDPFNLVTTTFFSAVFVAGNAHSAYGPGVHGTALLTGYSLVGETLGNFTSIYAIPVLAHEDPRYQRMPGQPLKRRILHTLVHTVVAQHDDGTLMPNYATLLSYPIGGELSSLYVPGAATDQAAIWKGVGFGLLSDPTSALVAEFVPDLAKRLHVHNFLAQQILLQIEGKPAGQ